jgi:hypothetical protein
MGEGNAFWRETSRRAGTQSIQLQMYPAAGGCVNRQQGFLVEFALLTQSNLRLTSLALNAEKSGLGSGKNGRKHDMD